MIIVCHPAEYDTLKKMFPPHTGVQPLVVGGTLCGYGAHHIVFTINASELIDNPLSRTIDGANRHWFAQSVEPRLYPGGRFTNLPLVCDSDMRARQ